MRQTSVRQLLREVVSLLLEEEGMGARLDAEEREAKHAYEKAQAELNQWRAEQAKKVAFVNKAIELGLNPAGDAARKRLKSDPRYTYDPKIVQKKEDTLVKQLEKAKETWGAYDPSVLGYRQNSASVTRSATSAELPEKGTRVYAPVSDLKPLLWYGWDDPRWSNVVKKISFNVTEKSGIGPGEERLAKIFGGKVQGGNTSFDLVTQDGRKWEVKQIEKAGEDIRPGTEGLAAFDRPKETLNNLMKQMKNFVSVAEKTKLDKNDNDEDKIAISYVKNFIENEYEMIVDKGEIAADRFKLIRSALKVVQGLKKRWKNEGLKDDFDTTVGLASKKIKVDKPTYIDVANKVQKSVPDANVLDGIAQHEIALAALRDAAFDDPSAFFDAWYDSIDVTKVFEQVDGVFIVSSKGFSLIPRGMLKKALKFNRVSQGKPKFKYAYHSDT